MTPRAAYAIAVLFGLLDTPHRARTAASRTFAVDATERRWSHDFRVPLGR